MHAVILDGSGVILAVNEGWKKFADRASLDLPDHGVGQNYLQHCAFADAQSAHIIGAVTQLLRGRADAVSFFYPCHGPDEPRWFLLLGFPYRVGEARAVLLHVEITRMMPDKRDPVILKDEVASASVDARLERVMEKIERSLRANAAAAKPPEPDEPPVDGAGPAGPAAMPGEPKAIGLPVALSRRQREVLELMAKGLSNIEIGRRLAISPNTVKIHVSGILARLGVPNRAQAIHWTLTRLRDER
ncbi:multi-sensor signal transduction histidine kinase [Rhodovulum sp. PH10]|nr:multi-sensor signal transduction histidine kinase [Rhodovulum sp. PH10]